MDTHGASDWAVTGKRRALPNSGRASTLAERPERGCRYRSSITAITTILKQLPRPDCTKDDALWRRAGEAYSGSIGRWKRYVHDEGAVHDFLDERIANLAEAFLMMRPRRAATRLSK